VRLLLDFVLTRDIYAFYAAGIGTALAPSGLFARWAYARLFAATPVASVAPGRMVLFCLCLGVGARKKSLTYRPSGLSFMRS
jgi:hypothetical protein